jgi:predicted PhzF superfamily epimerase YddE/YHI9
MSNHKAIVRQDVERISEVSRTWIEWGEQGLKTLVVEVTFDTDPNSIDFNPAALDQIEKAASGATTTMVISHLKIVPKLG